MTSSMLLSAHYKLEPERLDFVDLDFSNDIRLYVDPLLFWRSPHRIHHLVHARLLRFFETAIAYVKAGQANKAKAMCVFPEPENLLGKTAKGHLGHGLADDLGEKIYDELVNNPDVHQHGLTFLNELQLMIWGVHNDLVSDLTVNIAKDYFVWYTQEQCQRWGIPLAKSTTRIYLHDEETWDEVQVLLPINPETHQSYILTPKLLLRKELSYNYKDFYKYIRTILKERIEQDRLRGFAQKARVTWKEVEDEFPPTKEFVLRTVHEEPELRREFAQYQEPKRDETALQATGARLGVADASVEEATKAIDQLVRSMSLSDESKEALQTLRSGMASADGATLLMVLEEFNGVLKKARESVVVILGSYAKESAAQFDAAKDQIKAAHYEPCIIKDMPDVGSPNLRQKLFMYVAASRFVVVLDYQPSGHLTEIELLKDLGVPIAIISTTAKGSTYMLAGIDTTYTFVKRFVCPGATSFDGVLGLAIEWCEGKLAEDRDFNEANLPWLLKTGISQA